MTVCAYSYLNRGARYVFEHLERMASVVAEYLIIKIKTYMIGSPFIVIAFAGRCLDK